MAQTTKKRTAQPKVQAVPAPEPAEGAPSHAAVTCPVAWCPVCLAVSATQPLRPDTVEHLLKAGTELLLALRGVIDTRADQVADGANEEPAATRLEKIDLG